MLASAVWSFADPDEYALSVRATSMELAITQTGRFEAKAIRIDLHRLWLQRVSESLPRVAHFKNVPGRAIFSFRTQPGPEVQWDGNLEPPTGLARHSECEAFFQRTTGPTHLAAMSLPIETMAMVGEAIGESDFVPPK